MEIFKLSRCMGKTTFLIYQSHTEQKPIVVVTEHMKQNLINQAKGMGLSIPEPIVFSTLKNKRGEIKPDQSILIDDIDLIINQLFWQTFYNFNIDACMCSENDIGKIIIHQETTKINL